MKTIKEQADELVSKLSNHTDWENYQDIECALIAVDEIINTDMLIDEDTYVETKSYLAYWQEVKKEINAL